MLRTLLSDILDYFQRRLNMGCSSSKEASQSSNEPSKNNKRGKSDSPNQDKHNSADSKAPLAEHAADFIFPASPTLDHHMSFGELDFNPDFEICVEESHRTSSPHARPVSAPPATAPIQIDSLEGHSDVTRPPPPPRIVHLSELIDPSELAVDSSIRSPSGNLLAPEQFLVHPDRPRSMRERQEEIREKVRAASRLGVEVDGAREEKVEVARDDGRTAGNQKVKKKRGCCSCFGR